MWLEKETWYNFKSTSRNYYIKAKYREAPLIWVRWRFTVQYTFIYSNTPCCSSFYKPPFMFLQFSCNPGVSAAPTLPASRCLLNADVQPNVVSVIIIPCKNHPDPKSQTQNWSEPLTQQNSIVCANESRINREWTGSCSRGCPTCEGFAREPCSVRSTLLPAHEQLGNPVVFAGGP